VPLLPIDLQTSFAQTNQVGKEQAAQKDASPLAQSLQGAQLAQKAEHADKAVNEAPDEEDEAEKIKDPAGKGAQRRNSGGGRKKKPTPASPAADVVRDPSLGRNIDITS
jgi:hypothetical protein